MTIESNSNPTPPNGREGSAGQKPISPGLALAGVVAVLAIAGVLAAFGILHRTHSDTVLAERTEELAPPTVTVAAPKLGSPIDNYVLPGNVTAFTDAPIYARTSGYLKRWYFDIGSKVKKGALLAVIETPEVDQQLAQAEADLASAQANANNARIQAERYTGLVKSDAVSRQDTDTYVNQASATAAAVRSAQANTQRLREMQSFQKVYAPFDGVITARTIDTGQLIDQGAGKELFHLQAITTLRVYSNLPQIYSQNVKKGSKIDLTFAEHPGKKFQGTLVRTSDAIDPVSRTLLVEIDVDNRAGELMPGSLAQVHFKTPPAALTFIVPATALIFRKEGLRVGAVVNGNIARMIPVVIGEDDGANVQIVTGLSSTDQVIQNPPDSLIDGEKVFVISPGGNSDAGGK